MRQSRGVKDWVVVLMRSKGPGSLHDARYDVMACHCERSAAIQNPCESHDFRITTSLYSAR